jgi:hypothetical protein
LQRNPISADNVNQILGELNLPADLTRHPSMPKGTWTGLMELQRRVLAQQFFDVR